MPNAFKDHFSRLADTYAAFRPTQPATLIAWAAGLAPAHAHAWDCATGNGQAALALTAHFTRVTATDASAAQIARAMPNDRVTYRVAAAEASGLADASVDLVTVAQALHWFDLDAFYREVRRVLVPGGAIATWCYMSPRIDVPAVNALLQREMYEVLGTYWPPERRLIEEGYQSIPFPFAEVSAPALELTAEWTLAQLAGYMRSWSATAQYRAAHDDRDPITEFEQAVREVWPEQGAQPLSVRWAYAVRAGRA